MNPKIFKPLRFDCSVFCFFFCLFFFFFFFLLLFFFFGSQEDCTTKIVFCHGYLDNHIVPSFCYISRYFLHYFVSPFHRCRANAISTDYARSGTGQYTSRDGSNSVSPVRAY